MLRTSALAALLVLGVAAAFYPAGTFLVKIPRDEYGHQADAYLSGQLHLKLAPAPELLALPNPYDAGRDTGLAPRDVSLYRGHYYYYYGIAPIVTFILPVRLLTGRWPTQDLACAVLALLGALAAIALLSDAQQRFAPRAPQTVKAALWISVIFANGVLCWVAETGVNQLAVISAWCFLMILLMAGWLAQHSSRPALWMCTASAAFGLAVASKPTMIFAGIALVGFAWPLHRRTTWMAAIAPAAVIGTGLAWLNQARFGAPWEFGMRFALWSHGDTRNLTFFSLRSLGPNLHAYLFNLPTTVRHFPFIEVGWREPVGLIGLPFCWFAFAALAARGPVRLLAGNTAMAAIAVTIPITMFLFHWSRYQIECLSVWTLLGSIGLIALCARVPDRQQARLGWVALVAVILQTTSMSAVFFETLW